MRRLGIFCASFNPPLRCHIEAAETVMNKCALDEVLFAPLQTMRKENGENAGYTDRLRMCIASLVGKSALNAVPWETPLTLTSALKKFRKNYPGARLFCIAEAALISGLIERLEGKPHLKEIVFLCLYRDGQEKETVFRRAADAGLDVEFCRFPSLEAMELSAKQTVLALNDPVDMPFEALKICASEGLYLPDHTQEIKSGMSERRWQHTLGVRRTAVHLAEKYGASLIKCAAAAICHDCAKDMNPKDMRKIMISHGETADEEILRSGAMMHGPVGAYLAEEKFHVADREVLDAIRYHTTGRENMSLTERIIFVADAIEPGREDYPGLKEIRELSEIDLDAAALYSLYATREYVLSRGKDFNAAGQKTILALESQLNNRPTDPNVKKLLRVRSAAFE